MRRHLLTIFCAGLGLAATATAGVKVKVTGSRVNLRAAADQNVEVVSQVSTGEVLYAPDGVSPTSEWVRVEPPSSADAYIYGDLVENGKVTATRVNVRSGAGIAYRVIGRVEQGDAVTVRSRNGDWLRIAPPPQCSLWIHRDYIEPLVPKPQPKPVPKPPTPKPVVKPVPKPIVIPIPRPKPIPPPVVVKPKPKPEPKPRILERTTTGIPAAIAKRKLVDSKQQGVKIDYVGTLRRAGWVWGRPSKFRLVVLDDSGRPVTLCYLLGSEDQLSSMEGHSLQVYGKEYWIQGVRSSVVVPNQIIRKD